MRRIISIFTAATVLLSLVTVSASRYADVPGGASYSDAVENLSNYGIISGYNGYFNPDGYITRAEAAKIAAVVAGIDEEASARAGVKKFNDVETGKWSTGYINVVSDHNYILGYPNGYFMPDNNITFAEMTTIVLRLLGYDASVLGDNWPYAYMLKAGEMGITDGINLGDYDLINRAQVCVLVDNALDENIYGRGEKLSSLVSAVKYSEPVVIKNSDPYVDLRALEITRENIGQYSIIRDGYAAQIGDISVYDVVYLAKNNMTIYVYCDKITGIYKEAYPSKADVSSVEISGNVLSLETQTAIDKLGEKAGSYKINSRVTALMGRDGKIVDVIDMNSQGNSGYGVLLSVSETVSQGVYDKGEQTKYINVLTGDGDEVSYAADKDYGDYVGRVGKLDFDENGLATFKTESSKVSLTGAVDKANNKIGDTYLTSDATLIELVYEPSSHTGEAIARVIKIDDIAIDSIYAANVVFALETGDFEDVSFAVLKDVTNNGYTYGIVDSSRVNNAGMSISSFYTVIVKGQEVSYSANFGKDLSAGTPVAILLSGNSLVSINALKSASRGKLAAIDESRVKIGDSIFRMAEDVQIYRYQIGKGYTSLSVSQAKEYTDHTAAAFVDSGAISGGLVRIVIIYE